MNLNFPQIRISWVILGKSLGLSETILLPVKLTSSTRVIAKYKRETICDSALVN